MHRAMVEHMFTYHPPKGDQTERYARVREKGKELALLIQELTPTSPEQTIAIRYVHMATMIANSSVAIHENEYIPYDMDVHE